MTHKQIQYFEKAFSVGSIAEVASTLYVSRSVVSRAILELEEEFGIQLFERSKHGINPTYAGSLLHNMLREMIGSYNSLLILFKQMNNVEIQRELRIGVTPTNSRVICKIVFENFIREFPEVNTSIKEGMSGRHIDMLINGDVDVLITPGILAEATMFSKMDLYEVQMVLMTTKDNPLAKKETISIVDILDKPLGYLVASMPSIERIISENFSSFGKEPNIVLRTSDIDLLCDMARSGQVYAILPDNTIQKWDNAVGIPVDFAQKANTHGIVWNKAVPLNSAASDFIEFMKKYKAMHWDKAKRI